MMFSCFWKRCSRRSTVFLGSLGGGGPSGRVAARKGRLRLEELEGRVVPALVFPTSPGSVSVASDGGGELEGKVPVYLIFARDASTGFGYNGTVSAAQITSAFQTILSSGYLDGLAQYEPNARRAQAYLAGTCFNSSCLAGSVYGTGPYQITSQYYGANGFFPMHWVTTPL